MDQEDKKTTRKLTSEQIKITVFNGYTIKFAYIDNKVIFCADELYEALFGDNRYKHINKMREMSTEAYFEEGGKDFEFYSLEKFQRRFTEYKPSRSSYMKAKEEGSDQYENYAEFVKKGGVNWLLEKAKNEYDGIQERKFTNPLKDVLKRWDDKFDLMNRINKSEQDQDQEHEREEVIPVKALTSLYSDESSSWIRSKMTNPDVYLSSTIFLVICLIPFTFMALLKYMTISNEGWELYLSYYMVAGLSIAFDWSILVFTVNGKKGLANTGSIFQIIFISVHFDLLSGIFGSTAQEYITKLCGVIYAAILINQFSELATKTNEDNRN